MLVKTTIHLKIYFIFHSHKIFLLYSPGSSIYIHSSDLYSCMAVNCNLVLGDLFYYKSNQESCMLSMTKYLLLVDYWQLV